MTSTERYYLKNYRVRYLFVLLTFNVISPAGAQITWKQGLLQYVQTLFKGDGGYGWADQPDGHLTPTFAAIGILHNLNALPADSHLLAQYVRSHHPQRMPLSEAGPSGTEMRDLVYQQIQALKWLGGNTDSFKEEVIRWKPQFNKVSNFEEHGYPVLQQEMMSPICRNILGVSQDGLKKDVLKYLTERERPNGSFNNSKTSDGGDGNILNTYWAVKAMNVLHKKPGKKSSLAQWIKQCQIANGGFTHQPHPDIGANDDIAYTWAAVASLISLQTSFDKKQSVLQYVNRLHNADGGFSPRECLASTPMATYYAVDILKMLDALKLLDRQMETKKNKSNGQDSPGYKIYSVQFEAPGKGSPAEAVALADSLHINLWGAKNSTDEWRKGAQRIADEQHVPVIFFQSDEAYGKSVNVAGLGSFSHIMDFIAPANATVPDHFDGSSWQNYDHTFIDPLSREKGALILQVTNNESLGRLILDESINNEKGFIAISTIHFGQNFSFWLPWLWQYRDRLPFIALQDAHGTESWWWKHELTGYRTLFLGKDGTYEEMLTALKNNWVSAVRHDSISGFHTRMLGGAPGIQNYMRQHEAVWKWWGQDSGDLIKLPAMVTAFSSSDTFETGRPETGYGIRVRCDWNSNRQILKDPNIILESLSIDGRKVETQLVEEESKSGNIEDNYYLWTGNLTEGIHTVLAKIVYRNTGEKKEITYTFRVHEEKIKYGK